MSASGISNAAHIPLPILRVTGSPSGHDPVHSTRNRLSLARIVKPEHERGIRRVHQVRLIVKNDRHFNVVACISQSDRTLGEERLNGAESGSSRRL